MDNFEEIAPETTPESNDIEMDMEDFDLNHEEENQEVVQEEAQEEAQEETQEVEPFLQIKYNKEEKALSKEEAQILAQKGMNYDKVIQRLEEFENNPNLQYLNDLASRSNMSLDQLVGYWQEQENEAALNELLERNIPEEYAKEMLESRKFREQLQQKEMEQQQKNKEQKEFIDFAETFKDIKPEDIPVEVWKTREELGIPLKYAYMEYENSNLKKDREILINNQNNRKKAPGLGTTKYGSAAATQKSDPFLEGFFGE